MGYIFEWDPKKADGNARKHGVTFDEASTVFGDLLALLMPDPDHSVGERRYLVLGNFESATAAGGGLRRAATAHASDLSETSYATGEEEL